MEKETQFWMALAIVIYLVGWFVMVKVLRMMTPQTDEELEEYSEKHGIPRMNISDMLTGIAALWPFWIAFILLWFIYHVVRVAAGFILSLFR